MEGTHLPKILLWFDWLEQLIGPWNEYNGHWWVHLPQSPTRQSPTEDNLPLSATFSRRHLRNACQHTLHIYIPASLTTQFSNRKIWKLTYRNKMPQICTQLQEKYLIAASTIYDRGVIYHLLGWSCFCCLISQPTIYRQLFLFGFQRTINLEQLQNLEDLSSYRGKNMIPLALKINRPSLNEDHRL